MSKLSQCLGPIALVLPLALAGAGAACKAAPREEAALQETPAPAAAPAQTASVPAMPAAEATPAAAVGLRKVDEVQKVCMVNDQFMGKDQIPVGVEGKTYYGCCEMCKERLAKDEAIRYSTDPVSGARIDKATAVIGVLPDGSVLYFEDEASLEEYASRG